MANSATRACEFCGKPVTKTATQQNQRKYWTCGRVCANKRRIQLGNTPGWKPNPYRGQQETRPCGECGVPVTRYLSTARLHQTWYCSTSHAAFARVRALKASGRFKNPGGRKPRTGDTVACATCGLEFYRQPAYIKQNRRFCSKRCSDVGLAKGMPRPCAHCGKLMLRKPSQAAIQYCSRRCSTDARIKRPTGRQHNGRPVLLNAQGYYTVYEPNHPYAARANGRVLEHRLVVEGFLGRYLTRDEQVDHINRDKTDNRIENLQLLSPQAHTRKTNGDRKARELTMAERLAEYERRYGALDGSPPQQDRLRKQSPHHLRRQGGATDDCS